VHQVGGIPGAFFAEPGPSPGAYAPLAS